MRLVCRGRTTISTATMELMRSWGLEREVREGEHRTSRRSHGSPRRSRRRRPGTPSTPAFPLTEQSAADQPDRAGRCAAGSPRAGAGSPPALASGLPGWSAVPRSWTSNTAPTASRLTVRDHELTVPRAGCTRRYVIAADGDPKRAAKRPGHSREPPRAAGQAAGGAVPGLHCGSWSANTVTRSTC